MNVICEREAVRLYGQEKKSKHEESWHGASRTI